MHLLVNFATDVSKILKVFENNVSEGSNPLSFSNSNPDECGTSHFVRTSAKAFTEKGSDKAGVASHFNAFLDLTATCLHLNDIKEFLTKWNEPNHLLLYIILDMNEKIYIQEYEHLVFLLGHF